jgi:hypothetical protein
LGFRENAASSNGFTVCPPSIPIAAFQPAGIIGIRAQFREIAPPLSASTGLRPCVTVYLSGDFSVVFSRM